MNVSMSTERRRMGETHVKLPFGGCASTEPTRVRKPWAGKLLLGLFVVGVALLFVFFPLK